MLPSGLSSIAADPVNILIIFLLAHLLTGAAAGLRASVRPLYWSLIENAGLEIDRRLNRDGKDTSEIALRGVVVAVVMCGIGFLIGTAVIKIAHHPYGWIANLVFLSCCISLMGPLALSRNVGNHLFKRELKKAGARLQPYVREDLSKLDDHALVRKALEVSAWKLNQYFVAPIFWFLLMGAQGLAVYVTFAALQEAFGTDDPRHIIFGGLVRGIEKFLNYIPARITAILIVVAALFVSRSNPVRAVQTMYHQSSKYLSVNKGPVVAAMAGALGVTLGGSIKHNNGTAAHGWVGPKGSSAQATMADLHRGILIQFVVFLLGFALLGTAKWLGL